MAKNIDVKAVSFFDLMRSNLTIPSYQRAYSWRKEQLDHLIDDLTEFAKGDKPEANYYMGAIILHCDDSSHDAKFNIIDGQQRITTLLLLAMVVGLQECGDTFDLPIESPNSHQQIKTNYIYLLTKLSQDKIKTELLANVFKSLCFTRIITDNLDDAFTFFDTQNSRGVQPSVTVLLKAFHLRAIADINSQKVSASSWNKIEKLAPNLDQLTEYPELLEWLIHLGLWRGRRWVNTKKQEYETFEKIRDEFTKCLRKVTPNTAQQVKHYPVFYQEPSSSKKLTGFSLRQPIYQGIHFFQFISHYSKLLIKLQQFDVLPFEKKRVSQLISVHKKASKYSASFFTLITLVYYDRFREEKLSMFIKKLSFLLADFRLASSRIAKPSLEKAFIRCEIDKVNFPSNFIDLICSSFDAEEVIYKLREVTVINNEQGEVKGVRKYFKQSHDEFWLASERER